MNKRPRLISSLLATAAVVLLTGTAHPASAQYVISARAGFVNYTTGPVTYRSSSDPTWKEVPTQLQLEAGDHVKTEAWGKAEILLNPGSYLRIGHAAEVAVRNTDLAMASFELLSGSAILEVGNLQKGAVITLHTPTTLVRIKKDGLYRIDATPHSTTLTVRKGEAEFQQADGTFKKAKRNKTVVVTAHNVQIAKLDDPQMDDLDLWSADRAETLLAANQSVLRRRGYGGGIASFQSAWIYDPFFGCYTFCPWGFAFRSIYGYGYYAPWYYGGAWSGGYYPRGGGGSTRPGPPPPRTHKPKFTSRGARVRPARVSLRARTLSSRSVRPSVGFSRLGPGRAYRGRGIRATGAAAYTGHIGGGYRGPVAGARVGVRVGSAHGKVH